MNIRLEPNERNILVISGILIVSIFLFDASLAIGFVVSSLYVIPILICIWSPRRRTIFLVAGASSILTLVAIPIKPPGNILIPLFNRPVSLLALWTVAILADLFVTERKRAEKTLRESHEDLNNAQLVSQTGSWRLKAETNELLWSDETYRIFGIPKGTPMTNDIFLSLLHPDDRDHVVENWQAALRGEPFDIEHRVVVDGDVRWVREKALLEFDEDGVLRGGFGTVQDITERKQAMESLQRNEAILRGVITNLPIVLWTTDADGVFTLSEGRGLSGLGLKPGEVVGRSAFDMYSNYPAITDAMRQALSGTESPFMVDIGDTTFQAWAVPMRDEHGLVTGLLGVAADITEQKALEEDLKRSNEELQQFAYIASHDLQEPLRMVTAYLDLLCRRYGHELPAQAKEYMNTAVEGSVRMKELISDLLEYSRLDSRPFELEDVDMNKVARKVVETLGVSIQEANAKAIIEPLPTVMADEQQIGQVLQNLISNAIKFHADEPPRVEVSAIGYGNEYVFSVKDNGIGIDPRFKDKLFKMFQRLHTKEEYPGTGIGLVIAKKIVERHGGKIWFESEPGKGSTFYFTVPMSRGDVRQDRESHT